MKNNKIIALVLSATIIATTGCNSSGNNNTAVQTSIVVSDDTYTTEKTEEVTTAPTTSAEETPETTEPIETYVPTSRTDEVYNTTLEPNIPDNVTLEVNLKYYEKGDYNLFGESNIHWDKPSEKQKIHTIDLIGHSKYDNFINELPCKFTTARKEDAEYYNIKQSVFAEVDNKKAKYKFTGIKHYYNYEELITPNEEGNVKGLGGYSLCFELVDGSGNVLADAAHINDDTHIKAVWYSGTGTLSAESNPVIIEAVIKLPNGEEYSLYPCGDYKKVLNELTAFLSIDENNNTLKMGHDSNDMNCFAIKNNQYTLVLMQNADNKINRMIYINNNI